MSRGENEALRLLRVTVQSFAKRELARRLEANGAHSLDDVQGNLLAKAFEVGFFHVSLPESLGGAGRGLVSPLCTILGAIGEEDAGLGAVVFVNSLAQEILMAAGAHPELEKLVAEAADAPGILIAFPAFTDPGESELLVEARPSPRGFRLWGKVEGVASGGLARQVLIPSPVRGRSGYSLFLVDSSDARLVRSVPILGLGLESAAAVDLSPAGAKGRLVGEEDAGPAYFAEASDRLQVAAAALSAGVMAGSLKEALRYSQERLQGGTEIIHWSEVRMMLAEMLLRTETARLLISEASSAVDERRPDWRLASRVAAVFVQEAARDVVSDGVQVLGGAGYMKDFGQEKRFRDAHHLQTLLGVPTNKKLRLVDELIGDPAPELQTPAWARDSSASLP